MHITVAHTKSKDEIKRIVDRSFNDLFSGIGSMPFQIADEKRSWNGDTLTFSFTARVTLLSTPIKGTIVVTDRDVTVDVDLGLIDKFLPAAQTQAALETRVKGFLT